MSDQRSAGTRVFMPLLVLFLSVSALLVSVTGAVFTDTEAVGSNTLSTGSVDLSTSPSSALLTASGLVPGDLVENSITVTNAGSLELRYAIERSATNADSKGLRDSMRLRVAVRSGGACEFPYYNDDGSATTLSSDEELYEGVGFPATGTGTVGDSSQGLQSGDRTLGGGSSEVLCFAVVLPTSATSTVQGASTTATFDFKAEQTANN